MRQYRVKGDEAAYLTVLGEMDDELQVEIVKEKDGQLERHTEIITRNLFETCLNTNYLTPIDIPVTEHGVLEPALSA